MLRCLTWKTARSPLSRGSSGQEDTRREEEEHFRERSPAEELFRERIMAEEELFREERDTDTPQ